MNADVEQWLRELREADQEATRSQAAYVTGRFSQYWEERAAATQARLDAIYGDANGSATAGGDSQPDSDGGSGLGGGE